MLETTSDLRSQGRLFSDPAADRAPIAASLLPHAVKLVTQLCEPLQPPPASTDGGDATEQQAGEEGQAEVRPLVCASDLIGRYGALAM